MAPGHSFLVRPERTINGSGVIEPFSRKAIPLGPNLLVNGDFESGTTGWDGRNGAVLTAPAGQRTGGSGSNVLQVAYGGSNNPYARNNVPLTVGVDYRLIGWCKDDGVYKVRLGSSGGDNIWESALTGAWESFDVTYTAAGVYVILQHRSTAAAFAQFDDVTVHAV